MADEIPEEILEEPEEQPSGLSEESKEAIQKGVGGLIDRPQKEPPPPQPQSSTPTVPTPGGRDSDRSVGGASGQPPPQQPEPPSAGQPTVPQQPSQPAPPVGQKGQPTPQPERQPGGQTPPKEGGKKEAKPAGSDVKTPSTGEKLGRGLGAARIGADIARHPKEGAKEAGKAVAKEAGKQAAKQLSKRALQALTAETGVGPIIIEALDKLAGLLKKIPGVSGFSNWAWKNKWLVLAFLILIWLMPGLIFAAALGGMGGGGGLGGGLEGAAIIPTITDQALIDEVLRSPNINFSNMTARQEISEGHVQNSPLQAILAAANAGYKIPIYAAWTRSHPSNPNSWHHRGLALDISPPTAGLQQFLYNNAEALNIHDLFGPLDGLRGPQINDGAQYGTVAPGHKDHIHISTYP